MALLASVIGFGLNACASHSDKIQASYVSPLEYSEYSCKQIKGELSRVGRKMNEVAGVQDKTASNDAVAMGVGLVLLWPALFFIDSSDQHVELARLSVIILNKLAVIGDIFDPFKPKHDLSLISFGAPDGCCGG